MFQLVLLLLLSATPLSGLVDSCYSREHPVARRPGDIMLGGIFPIHDGVYDILQRPHVDGFTCTGLQLQTMVDVLSMIYTIEKINNSTLLQGIQLGYEIHDSCSYALKAVQGVTTLIPEISSINSSQCSSSEIMTTVKAVIGEIYSENSITMGRMLSSYFIPQLSGASSADILSDVMRFPSFLRTIPSDYYQTKAIVELIRTFGWNWVGIIASDDDYGRSALDSLSNLFKTNGICMAFSRLVPSYVEHPSLQESLNDAINDLKTSTAEVVIAFAKRFVVAKLFETAIQKNGSRTWIASDEWIVSNVVASTEGIEKVGTVFGFTFESGYVPGFQDFIKNLYPASNGSTNEFLDEYKALRFGCSEEYLEYLNCLNSSSDNCSVPESVDYKSPVACKVEDAAYENDDFLAHFIENGTVYSTSLAVTAVAQALKNILCRNGTCDKALQVSPRELLTELKKGTYVYNGKTFRFNNFGEVLSEYKLINWQKRNHSIEYVIVGEYDTIQQTVIAKQSLLLWNNINNSVPFSNCSATCKPGYFMKHSFISCCYECLPCANNTFSSSPGMTQCQPCSLHQWSYSGSSRCVNRTVDYFAWNNAFAITLETLSSLAMLLVLLSAGLFMKYSHTPPVKAAGGPYAYLLMLSLLVSLASTGVFIGQPSDTLCKIRQPLYGISFTLAVSCILIKSIRILLAFESATKGRKLEKLTYQPILLVIILTGIQICICVVWHVVKGPAFTEIYTIPERIIQQCDEGSYVALGIMLGYMGLLALTCFIVAYKGRKLPERYNEARCITFSMLVYMFVWILFIPIYINVTSGIYLSAVQVVAILSSVYAVISCHLLPVCYMVLFKRDSCTRERYLESVFRFYRTKICGRSVIQKTPNQQEAPSANSEPDIETGTIPQENAQPF
ncbi:G-protein coupled receptor family C group 6 member A-like [Hyperolius riggenbachi]|uniref:G-protein coupled receptor family C group 6 member A-like n=1 Tax=Hyperolius riggenbachi TaxID=752182 RepID=UPI0035A36403